MKPTFLEGYDLFAALVAWEDTEGTVSTNRAWDVRSFGKTPRGRELFACTLRYTTQGQQKAFIQWVEDSPEEAVYGALSKFFATGDPR